MKLTSASRRVPRLCDASRARAPLVPPLRATNRTPSARPHEDEHEDERGPHGAADYLLAPSARREGLDGGRHGAEVGHLRRLRLLPRALLERDDRAVGLGRLQRLEVVDEDVDGAARDRQLLEPAGGDQQRLERTSRRWRS
jgi:hypothetical protein